MARMRERFVALTTLATVSAVSLLAGGIILGSASADDGDTAVGAEGKPIFTRVAPEQGATCIIAFGEGTGGLVAKLNPATPAQGVTGMVQQGQYVDAGGDVKTFRIVDGELVEGTLPEGGLPDKPVMITRALEAKELNPEEIERLKAGGNQNLVTPTDCKVLGPEDAPAFAVPHSTGPAVTFEFKP